MSRFIESICILDGEIRNLELHQKRFNETRLKVFGVNDDLELKNFIQIPKKNQNGKFKCRILYAENLEEITFIPYKFKIINSIRLIENPEIDYSLKWENRQIFEDLKKEIKEDELIISQNGYITDSSYSNLIFSDGKNWFAPKTYLLNGVMRQSLLNSGRIMEKEILVKDLKRFSSFKLINAMMDLAESLELDISLIT